MEVASGTLKFCGTASWLGATNVTVSGGSMGAFQATAAAALDSGVNKLIICKPWLCDLRAAEAGKLGGWRPEAAAGLDYYDTASFASRVRCETVLDSGLGDYVCPPSGVTALYHNLRGTKRFVMFQNRTHPYTAPEYATYEING